MLWGLAAAAVCACFAAVMWFRYKRYRLSRLAKSFDLSAAEMYETLTCFREQLGIADKCSTSDDAIKAFELEILEFCRSKLANRPCDSAKNMVPIYSPLAKQKLWWLRMTQDDWLMYSLSDILSINVRSMSFIYQDIYVLVDEYKLFNDISGLDKDAYMVVTDFGAAFLMLYYTACAYCEARNIPVEWGIAPDELERRIARRQVICQPR